MTAAKPLVLPFRGERYARASLDAVLAPPYDVISHDSRKTLAARDPHNIVHLILPEAAVAEEKYAHAAHLLAEWRKAGVLAVDPGPSVYVVAQDYTLPSGEHRTRVGMLAAVSAEPYDTKRIKPHEKTHAGPKADRLALLKETQTGLESIFLLAPDADRGLTKALLEVTKTKPAAQGTLDGVGHRLWVVTGKAGDQLAERASAGALYIADGHHRYETAVAYARENPKADRVMAFIVSAHDPGLVVLPTHRVIYGAGRDVSHLIEQWKLWFEVTPGGYRADPVAELARAGATQPACFVALPDDGYTLVLRSNAPLDDVPALGASPALRSLDVAVIEPLVVKQILGAGTSTPTLTYTPDAKAALDAVRNGRAAASVLLNATKVSQVVAVADAGEVMPQKSTYFVPKVPAGLVLKP
ncbi:MAG TPA: DUF1015 domain-containing protein [Gemmatimonadales bacterium]|nr:DUF1015 domain-containing protein [Gemmatimonadales bacterium]